MKNTWVMVIVVIALLVVTGGGILLVSRSGSKSANTTLSTQTSTTNSASTQPVKTNQVSIKDFAFSPAAITVAKGTTVTWTNNDSTVHTVTESDGQTGPGSDQLTPGKSYSFTFTNAGAYHYRCTLHADMTGTVIVTE